ncbi:STE family protein kinase [Tritrichomonas foetus]|uniref:non-specific serine/threonine protein kinase n=1 Tax=Tritrichomonas foetus TaxID=1144522 RepID=A0A1J4K7K2_9EUKA|nr:STE family protein kinase [Tritrichomonas foetus]|eukprot:OHT06864.1 STE family protein kinase [Tritrichomonas foetus]
MKQLTNDMLRKRIKTIFEIGSGGFGQVEKAYDNERKEIVAIKTVENFVPTKQTMREFTFLLNNKHENIVSFNDSFVVGNKLYLSIEYCPYGNIAKYKSIMKESLVLCIIRDVSRALKYIHSLKMIHSDVKPQNILFSKTGDVKLADFGIIHNQDSISIQKTGEKDGSPLYMAPEMLSGRPVDSSIDIWALGITAFEMLTGVPLKLTGFENIKEWIQQNKPKWSDDMKKLLISMLEINPSMRPSAESLLKTTILRNLQETWLITSEVLMKKNQVYFEYSDDE